MQDYIRSDLVGSPPKLPTPLPGETPAQALERVQWLRDDTELAINRQILAAPLRSDVEIKGDYNPRIFHQKFILHRADQGSCVRSVPSNVDDLIQSQAPYRLATPHRES